jgi:molybdate transport system substrate-binding protein
MAKAMVRWVLLTLWGLALTSVAAVHAGEVTVAVSANFAAPAQRIATAFTQASGHTVKLSPGATGKFYSQIVSGAPFDVLLSADDETPRRLAAEGHGLGETRFTYAVGRLVLWSPEPGLVDDGGAVLKTPKVSKIAIADPKVAPYGAAAMEVLRHLGLAGVVQSKLVTGASIAQAFQFVSTGNADVGFVALSQVSGPGVARAGSMWRVPPHLHSEIQQDAIVLKPGVSNRAAREFLAFLRGETARAIMGSYGYGP